MSSVYRAYQWPNGDHHFSQSRALAEDNVTMNGVLGLNPIISIGGDESKIAVFPRL